MSANNQVLVKEYKGHWYVFNNVMAESWYDPATNKENELSIKRAKKKFDTEPEAYDYAYKIDNEVDERFGYANSEYGVHSKLAKDGAEVIIID